MGGWGNSFRWEIKCGAWQDTVGHFRHALVQLLKYDGTLYKHSRLPGVQAVIHIFFVVDGKQVRTPMS